MSNLKRFLALTLAMLMVVGAMVTVSAKSFTDVAAADAYAEAVDVLSELGVIAGTSADEFSPETLVERQQMAMFIARLATAQPALFAGSAGAVFADQTAPVYNAAIAYASSNGFVKGTSATTFNGNASVTLQEAATMLSRVLGYGNKTNDASYPFSYMVLANEIGLLKGLEDVAPTAALTRGEVATMLYNALTAPKAERELLYTPDGQDWVVSVPQKFYDNDTTFDKLASKPWNFKNIAAYVSATKDFGIGRAPVSPSKSIADPVIVNGYNTDAISYASITKYLPEDATANDLLGVDLSILARGSKILKIDVVGSKVTTNDVKYDNADGKQLVTVNGIAYNLKDYFTGDYPTASDNCFYMYSGKQISRIGAIPATFEQIKTGFFVVEIINEGAKTQKIVFKPLTLGEVTEKDGKLQLGGVNISDNTVGAKKGDFATYFSNGENLVVAVAVAQKSTLDEVTKLNTTTKVATFKSGATAPTTLETNKPLLGVSAESITKIGSKYTIWTVNGQVVKLAGETQSTDYVPKAYYVVDDAGKTNDGFKDTYIIKVIDQTGAASVKTITKIDTNTVAAVPSALVGTVIVFDATDATIVHTVPATPDNLFYGSDKADDSVDALGLAKADISTTGKIVDLGSVDAVLTSNTKVVLYDATGKKYNAYAGTSFSGITATGIEFFAVYHNNGTLNELVYLYAVGTAKDTSSEEKDNLYLFVSQGDVTATTVAYNAINLATGALEVVTYTNADGTTSIIDKAAGAASLVYNVKPTNKVPTKYSDSLTDATSFKVLANGYISSIGGGIYSTNNTKFYVWNVDTKTYDAKAFADIDKTKVNTGKVIFDNNKNATYVVIQGQDKVVATIDKGAVDNTSIKLTTTVGTLYYALGDSTTYTKYDASTGITGLTKDTTYTVKAYAAVDGYINSDVTTLTVKTTNT